MATLRKTNAGTVGAWPHNTGIACGIRGKYNCISIEEQNGKIVVLLNDDQLDADDIKVIHTDKNWNRKGE